LGLGAALLLAVMLPVGAGGASASAETFLGSINVPLDGSKVYSAPLVAGGVYRIAASGTYTQTGLGNPVDRDALYCFNYVASLGACSPSAPVRQYPVAVLYEGSSSSTADVDALNPATTLAYSPLHTYQETFTAASSTRLEIFCRYCNPTYSYSGAIRLDLFLVSLPPAPGPGGGGSPGATASPRLLPAATAWGQTGPAAALAPGDAAIASSPPISSSQRGVTVTLSGDVSGETAVVIGTPKNVDQGFKASRINRGDCVRAAVGIFSTQGKVSDVFNSFGVRREFKADEALVWTYLFLRACLEYVRELEERAPRASPTAIARAARASCRVRAIPLSVRLDRVARTFRWGTRRASRNEPVRRLRGSCRQARDGTVTVRIRAASKRVKLRKVLGPRFVVGAYRSTAASGTASVRATFKRR
jgi:hypothetical protein